jgi:very-short-patch-repair endonuclease
MVVLRGKADYPFYFGASPEILDRARELRNTMTQSERILWQRLRRKQIDGFKFRRQHAINQFIVDFFCYEAMLIIEVDGGVHSDLYQKERDEGRTAILSEFGLRVIRFSNDEIEYGILFVIDKIREEVRSYQKK